MGESGPLEKVSHPSCTSSGPPSQVCQMTTTSQWSAMAGQSDDVRQRTTAHATPRIAAQDRKSVRRKTGAAWCKNSVSTACQPVKATVAAVSRVRQRIEAVLSYAKYRGLREGENPATRENVKLALPAKRKVRAVESHAALPFKDMPAFMAALRMQEGTAARAFEFAILTAARTGEVLLATWGEIDLDEKRWTIPGERMKAGKMHSVPLIRLGTLVHLAKKAGWWGRTGGASASDTFAGYSNSFEQRQRAQEDWASEVRPVGDAHANEWAARVAKFRGHEPDEDANQPEPQFWDDARTLPRFPGGSTGIAYGKSGAGKTTVVLAVIMEAIQSRGARVAMCAGEGAYGLGKMRVPAQCEVYGVPPASLRGKYRTIPSVPQLMDPSDTEAPSGREGVDDRGLA